MNSAPVEIEIPEPFEQLTDLFDVPKYRHYVYHGGRGGAKSRSIAMILLLAARSKRVRVLNAREIQLSIADSVHKLYSDLITFYGFIDFKVTDNEIRNTVTGSEFIFKGLRAVNVSEKQKIKSLEGVDFCWIEEAQAVTHESLDILIPTIRKENSCMIYSYNRFRRNDPVHERFCTSIQPDVYTKQVNYTDVIKFLPKTLIEEAERCKKFTPELYPHIWLGEPLTDSKNRVFYAFSRQRNLVDYELKQHLGCQVWRSWDFGIRDMVAVVWYQIKHVPKSPDNELGLIIEILKEYVDNEKDAHEYGKTVPSMMHGVAHDAGDPSGIQRNASKESWIGILSKYGINVQYTNQYSVEDMVSNANRLIPFIKVNEKQCPRFVEMMEYWLYKSDAYGNVQLNAKPEHNDYSHIGTSFYYFCINFMPPVKKTGGIFIK